MALHALSVALFPYIQQTVHRINYQWTHKMSDIISAVGGVGLRIEYLHEFPYTFCDIWNWAPGGIVGRMEQDEDGWWWPTGSRDVVPLMFTLKACKDR